MRYPFRPLALVGFKTCLFNTNRTELKEELLFAGSDDKHAQRRRLPQSNLIGPGFADPSSLELTPGVTWP